MKYLKTYEILNGASISKSLMKDIRIAQKRITELIDAIEYNDYNDFKKLIDNSNLEEIDKHGNTALLYAAKEGRLKMLKELIKHGADIYHKNDKGEDFYDMAENRYKFINGVKDWIEETYPEIVASKKYNL